MNISPILFLTFPILSELFVYCKCLYSDLCLVFQQRGTGELFRGRCSLAVAWGTGHHPRLLSAVEAGEVSVLGGCFASPHRSWGSVGERDPRAVPPGAEASRGAPAACSARCLPSRWRDAGGVIALTRGHLRRLEQVPSD